MKTRQAEKNLHGTLGWKLRLTKRLTQESSQTVSSAVPSINMPHRLDTPGFPLCWHPLLQTFLLLSGQKKEVSRQRTGHEISTYNLWCQKTTVLILIQY